MMCASPLRSGMKCEKMLRWNAGELSVLFKMRPAILSQYPVSINDGPCCRFTA
jgi:hypothetical protein